MAEEESKQDNQEEEVKDDGADAPSENLSIVDEAKRLRDEIRAENDRREGILKEEQKLRAEQMLASSAGGGIPPKEQKAPTDREFAEAALKGELLE